jgi:hypothetical protein
VCQSSAPDFGNSISCAGIWRLLGKVSRQPRLKPKAVLIPHLSMVACSWKQFQHVSRFNAGNRSIGEAQLIRATGSEIFDN